MADAMREKVARSVQDNMMQGECMSAGFCEFPPCECATTITPAALEACHFDELVEALKDVLDETVDESAVRRARAVLAKVEDQ